MAKENERAVAEMVTLADAFEKEVAEEGELEPAARVVARCARSLLPCACAAVLAATPNLQCL